MRIDNRKTRINCFVPFNSKLLSRRPLQNGDVVPGQTTTLLPDGRVLKVGGMEEDGPVSTVLIEGLHIRLQFARAWHTATMLPNGKILIAGGMGADGQPIDIAEILDPETQTSEQLTPPLQSSTFNPRSSISPRVYHTATLLTDGLVLISGGVSGKGEALRTAQLWDFRSNLATNLRSKLKSVRYNHTSTLLSSGKVLLSGGTDKNGVKIDHDELYDPQTQRFTKANPGADNDPQPSIANPRLSASLPEDGATNVLLDAFIAIRFSKSLRVEMVNDQTVTLTGPYGRVETKVVPAEDGKLVFVTPKAPLLPGASYTASLAGATDKDNSPLVSTSITLTTASPRVPLDILADEDWIPNSNDLGDEWQTGRPNSQWLSSPPLRAQAGETALAGQVLTLNGQPLPRVTLKIDNRSAQTDEIGRFLVDSLTPGHHELLIDGRSASRAGKTYGVFEAGVDITGGKTNDLSYTIWMPKLDTAHTVTIPSPTTSEVVVTTPRIPGLEVRIPAGAVIRDHDGKVVTEVSITAIPLDRTPFPPTGAESSDLLHAPTGRRLR